MMKHILVVLTALVASACTTHRLPPLPPERDPTSESAPVTRWRAPPDVLHDELNDGAAPSGGHDMHDMPGMKHDMPGMKQDDMKDMPGMKQDDMKDMPGMKQDDMKDMPGMQHGKKSPVAPAEKKEAP